MTPGQGPSRERDESDLRARLEEAEETLRAIRDGEVDAIVVASGDREQIYTLKGADHSYRVFMDQMTEGAAILGAGGRSALDGTAVCTYSNPCMGRILGLPLEKVVGGSLNDWIDPAEHARLAECLERARFAPASGEFSMRRSDGSAVPVLLSVAAAPIDAAEAFCLVVNDMTERKHAEHTLRRMTRVLRMLRHCTQAVSREADEASLLRAVCRIVVEQGGYRGAWISLAQGDSRQAARPVAHAGIDLAPGPNAEVLWADDERGLRSSAIAIREGRPVVLRNVPTSRQLRLWAEESRGTSEGSCAVLPIVSDGQALGALTILASEADAFDAPELAMLGELVDDLAFGITSRRLALADQHKDEFLATLSHELRNPLAPIKNSMTVLHFAPPGGEQARRARDVIERQVDHLTQLIDDLLDLTRVARGKVQLRRQRVDLAELARRTTEDHRTVFDRSGVALVVVVPAEPLWVDADPTRVVQVIGNLLQNAAKFAGKGGRAVLVVDKREALNQVRLRISDTGPGIAPDMLAHIFEPFVQADRTLARTRGGLGLGLSLVKGIVELHGGAVDAHSEGIGAGAEFTVRLPLASAAAHTAEPEAAATTTSAGARRVLVIEDNEDGAASLREVLELAGHHVEIAHDGGKGIAIARGFHPDVVLCDIGLPGMDGYEVARAFRSDPDLSTSRLIALSGYALPEDLARARQSGFHDHLAKPADPKRLESILAGCPARAAS